MKTRQRMRNTTCILLLVLLTVAAPGALASAPAQTPDIADASLAPAAPSATLLVHFDAANIDGTGTQSGDICGRTNTTWVNLANPGTNNGTLVNVTMPCTADEGWKGDGGVASPYRLHLNGPGSGVWGADYVSFGTLTAPRSFNLWFYVDVDASGYLFSLTNNYTRAFLNGVTLEVAYNQSPTRSTGIATGVWHMLTMTNDGTMNRFYLDNVEFAAVAGSPLTGSVSGNLGKASVGAADQGLNGSIAEYSVYSDALSRTDITALYQNGRYRFEADSGQVQIDRIQNAFSSPAGGQQVTLHGQHFENITGVTFDDLPGTNVTVLDQSRLTVTAPAHVPGYVDVQVISSTRGSDTRLAAFRYTETPIDNLQLWLDAGNVDTLGAKGEGTVSRAWKNLTYGSDGELRLVDQPGTASEGWKGGGWPSDPFRLELGRGGNYVGLAMNAPRSVNIWFSFDQLPVNVDNVLLSAQYVMVVNHVGQNLRLTYHDGAVQQIPVSPGSNMLTVANDGTTTRYYLNGNEVASEVWSPATAYAATAILGTFGGYITSKEWDGSLCSVRFYNDYLTPAEVTQLYEEEENCVVWPLPTVSVGSLVWEDTDGDGLQEVGEPGIANATVRLLDPLGNAVTDAEGQLVQPQITGADGLYNFGNLKKGSYRVEVALPDGSNLQATTLPVDPSPDTNPDNLDSNGLVQEVCDTPTVRINQQVAPNDFQDQGV
ncbi:MAG TPA: SdrD B-like domain-containing protein, partial [Anaerolineae bacterium]|nr:SdrD B-like domain-containing protein [Anaerolineae bacterium]